MHSVFARKNEFKSIFCPILLSKPIMGIDYIDNVLDYKNALYSKFFHLS